VFATAREKAKQRPPRIYLYRRSRINFAHAFFGRGLNIQNTVVPQFAAEMDGLVSLENVVVILTSNRPDYIDPAILRPERIDRKVKIRRPDRHSARQIFEIY
jgi:proteasome-associated ATPase